MNVTLPPDIERFVAEKLQSGSYSSQSEIVQEGLRLLMERDRVLAAKLAELRGEVAIGLEQARRGELLPGEEVFEKLRDRSRSRQQTGS